MRRSDGTRLRIVEALAPITGAESVQANLEDAYLYAIAEGQKGTAA